MTGLRGRAILEIDLEDETGTTRTCVFELREGLEPSSNITRRFLLSNKGQYIREAYDIGSEYIPGDLDTANTEDRRGYHVDGGAGQFGQTITAAAGDKDASWGDGSTDPNDPADISRYDATGCDLTAQKQILEWVTSQAATGSKGQARLHLGEWTDGSYSDPGVFDRPFVVAIPEVTVSRDPTESKLKVTLEMAWTAVFPEAVVEEAQDAVDEIINAIPEH